MEPVPGILLDQGVRYGSPWYLDVSDPRHPHDPRQLVVFVLDLASEFSSHGEGDKDDPFSLPLISCLSLFLSGASMEVLLTVQLL